ncbi:hypothetical protein TRAPUB_2399 [Trametes pubescens]|uniref:BTB domain-containing protein n=1 Tax=Trametes pubescens TaxID=154538 RepID=A0A1M2VGS0_TRAPU|nr:hypothetical protein TRAPUB_2399 [Trametes pubescens]
MGTLATLKEVPIFERHPTLYLDDGDVVLQAPISSPGQGEKQKFQLFCIQKALLIAHSVVFANLFADASANLGSRCDSRPLISMPDEVFDLSHLLLYLTDPSQYLLRSSHPDTALELYGAAKLADKYMMNTVRSAMVKRVAMDWPTTRDEWDARQTGIQNLRSKAVLDRPRPGKRPRKLILALRTPEPVSAIMFA